MQNSIRNSLGLPPSAYLHRPARGEPLPTLDEQCTAMAIATYLGRVRHTPPSEQLHDAIELVRGETGGE